MSEDRKRVREEIQDWSGEYPPAVQLTAERDPKADPVAVDDDDKSWAYEAAVVSGEIVRFAEGVSQEFGPYPIIVIHEDALDEEVSIHAFHEVLISSFSEHEPEPGDSIVIRRLENRQGDNYEYANYEVRYPDADSAGGMDFDRFRSSATDFVENQES